MPEKFDYDVFLSHANQDKSAARELARQILEEEGKDAEIRCQQRKCDRCFPLWDVIERKFASQEFQQRMRARV